MITLAKTTSTSDLDFRRHTTPCEWLAPVFKKLPLWITRGLGKCRELAPYAAIELILPGGSLIALVLWFYRRRSVAIINRVSNSLACDSWRM